MADIETIMQMLDWNQPSDIQEKGLNLAYEVKNLWNFVQPLKATYSKSVWDNCAKILEQKTDKELEPYLIPLLEWIQDLNWPGSATILERLKKVDSTLLIRPYCYCIMRAIEANDDAWLGWLSAFTNCNVFSKSDFPEPFYYEVMLMHENNWID